MFTGIIEEIGTVKSIRRGAQSVTLEIEASKVLEDAQVGDSIATNGVCLTITSLRLPSVKGGEGVAFFDVMPETMRRTSFASLAAGSRVNLERALTLQTRLGGHIVSGHIDGTGVVARIENEDNARWLYIQTAPQILRYVIEKGSITIQGVSLTVARVERGAFAVSLIPHTQQATTLHQVRVGDMVNLENDIIGKYVERLLNHEQPHEKSVEERTELYRQFLLA